MDIKVPGITSSPSSILKKRQDKKQRVTQRSPENSVYRAPPIFSKLASGNRPATVWQYERLPWAERRIALQSLDRRLDDAIRHRPRDEVKASIDEAKQPRKIRFNEEVYVSYNCDIADNADYNISAYQETADHEPTFLVISALKSDEKNYYRENQYTSEVARPILLEDTEQPNEAPPRESIEATTEVSSPEEGQSTDGVTLPEGLEFSRVFSRSPSAAEMNGKSLSSKATDDPWRSNALESKWLALYGRARQSDEKMQKWLDKDKPNKALVDATEKAYISNKLVTLQGKIRDIQQFRIDEKRDNSFTEKKAGKETRIPEKAYDQFHDALTAIQGNGGPSLSQLTIVLAEFSLAIGSERDSLIAKQGIEAIDKIIKKRNALMR